jgi:hypothetical protein
MADAAATPPRDSLLSSSELHDLFRKCNDEAAGQRVKSAQGNMKSQSNHAVNCDLHGPQFPGECGNCKEHLVKHVPCQRVQEGDNVVVEQTACNHFRPSVVMYQFAARCAKCSAKTQQDTGLQRRCVDKLMRQLVSALRFTFTTDYDTTTGARRPDADALSDPDPEALQIWRLAKLFEYSATFEGLMKGLITPGTDNQPVDGFRIYCRDLIDGIMAAAGQDADPCRIFNACLKTIACITGKFMSSSALHLAPSRTGIKLKNEFPKMIDRFIDTVVAWFRCFYDCVKLKKTSGHRDRSLEGQSAKRAYERMVCQHIRDTAPCGKMESAIVGKFRRDAIDAFNSIIAAIEINDGSLKHTVRVFLRGHNVSSEDADKMPPEQGLVVHCLSDGDLQERAKELVARYTNLQPGTMIFFTFNGVPVHCAQTPKKSGQNLGRHLCNKTDTILHSAAMLQYFEKNPSVLQDMHLLPPTRKQHDDTAGAPHKLPRINDAGPDCDDCDGRDPASAAKTVGATPGPNNHRHIPVPFNCAKKTHLGASVPTTASVPVPY